MRSSGTLSIGTPDVADVVITEFMDEDSVARLSARFDTHYDASLADDPEAIPGLLANARALVVRNRTLVDANVLAAARELRVVGRLGVGLDNIDQDAAAARGVAVVPATGANDDSVAEYVVTTATQLLRGAYGSTAEVIAGGWPRNRLIGREVMGKTLGLVGCGAIARETARRALAMEMTVAGYDPLLAEDAPIWSSIDRVPELTALLASADVVSLHVPLTASTRHLIDRTALAVMKSDAVLINAARGGVVDEPALAQALREGKLGGAALDVFETEPLTAEAGTVFEGCPNLILTPHVAGVTRESNERVGIVIADAVIRHLEDGA